jgi:hypothetical protein
LASDLDEFFRERLRYRKAIDLKAFNIGMDRVPDVGKRFFAGFFLRNAARQCRYFGNKPAVFIFLDKHSICHAR